MKTKVYYLKNFIILFLISILISCTSFGQEDVTKEIQKVNQKFMDAFKAGDFKTISLLYTDDSKMLPPNSVSLTGSETITKVWEGSKSMGVKEVEFNALSAVSAGNLAIEEGEYKLIAPDNSIIDHGKYCVTWKKINNEWKVYKDIWNTNNPPAPRATMNDTIMVVTAKIKAEDRQECIDRSKNYYGKAFAEFYPEVKNRTRLFYSVKPDKEGYIQILYCVEPYHGTDNHEPESIMGKKFSNEEVEKVMKENQESLFYYSWDLLKQVDF